MAKTKTYHDAFLDELRDAYDAEKQIVKALPRMIRKANADDLRQGLEAHLEETRAQVGRLEQAFEALGEKARGKHCEGMAGILEEGKGVLEEDFDESTTDACIIAAAQRVEHYEIAAYGTLVAWAQAMGHDEVVALLEQTLDEEKAADEKLTAASGAINEAAARMAEENDEDMAGDDEEDAGEEGSEPAQAAGARGNKSAPAHKRR